MRTSIIINKTSHFLTVAGLGFVVLAPTWKRLFVGSPLLASSGSTFGFNRLTFYFPRLQQFMITADNLRFGGASSSSLMTTPLWRCAPVEADVLYALSIAIRCWHLD